MTDETECRAVCLERDRMAECLKAIVDGYGVGTTPQKFAEHVADFIDEARKLLAESGHRDPSRPHDLHAVAMAAVERLDDWANYNETAYTGWGDQIVPPVTTFWRVKSGQALKALQEISFDRRA